jgi:hypothetical protein
MKITIRHPAGLEISFEGNEEEFNRFTTFLGDPPSFVGALPAADRSAGGDGGPVRDGSIDPQMIVSRFAEVGAASDVERVTVMAQIAVEAGRDGIDYPEVDRLYEQLGERKPANMRQTFSNAKRAGFVRSVGQGRWRPTVGGENFARLGIRPRRGRRGTQLAPQGGERGD